MTARTCQSLGRLRIGKALRNMGGSRMYFAPLTDYDRAMKEILCGKVIIVWKIWEYFAGLSGADFTEPITAGN